MSVKTAESLTKKHDYNLKRRYKHFILKRNFCKIII
jgi:hypothetical protein